MLTWDDFLAFCDLTEDEVEAIAAHERVPKVIAAQIGHYLIHSPGGEERIRAMILDEIDDARARNNAAHVAEFEAILRRFDALHGTPARH
jgi:hypothetical protein